jgi:CS domain
MSPSQIAVTLGGEDIIKGELFQDIKAEDSTWYIADGVLHISLLKRNRRGFYIGEAPSHGHGKPIQVT